MAQPNPYAKATDFTEYQTEHASAPFSGALLDAELVDIETNLQGLNTNIALLQRDDGELANEVVGVAALDSAVLALIASESFTVRGSWATTTVYALGDIVENTAVAYLCLIAHTSGTFATDLTAVKWVDITGSFSLGDTLTSIENLTGAADRSIYFTGTDIAALYTLTAAGRALLDDATADAQLTTLGGTVTGIALFKAATAAAARSTAGVPAIAGDNLTGGLNDKSSTVASATSPDIFATTVGGIVNYTGTATCTGFTAAPQAGANRIIVCDDAAVFTAGANLLIDGVASASNYTAQAGDKLLAIAVTTTQFRLTPLPYGAKRDDGAVVANAADPTKKVRISAAGVATATTRVVTLPDADLILAKQYATVAAHATTCDPWISDTVVLSGAAVTFTDLADADYVGQSVLLLMNAAHVWTDGAVFDVQGGATYTTAAGDWVEIVATAVDAFDVTIFPASGQPVSMSPITNSIAGNVALNNTANYFTGPTIAQGTAGTWFASGTVTLVDTAGAADFHIKLWDGATVIASAQVTSSGANAEIAVSVSGYIASPAGNIRIDVKDVTSTSGAIIFNGTGNSKDSTVTAIRIA